MRAKAIEDPIKIPIVIVIPINPPTWPRSSGGTVPGAFTAHKVDAYPWENANNAIFKIMNQSDPKIFGLQLNAINKNVATKITLPLAIILMPSGSTSNRGKLPTFCLQYQKYCTLSS